MSVTVSHNGLSLFGVGIESLTSIGDNAGTFTITDAASTRIKTATVNSFIRNNITHTLNGGVSTNSKVFSFDWIAPAAGTGDVTFYFSGVAANGNNNNNLDYVYNSSQVFTEACTTPSQSGNINGSQTICQNSSSLYSISPVSGATSYTWTLPSGWTGISTTASITVTAGTSAGDITVTANNTCGSSPATTLAVSTNPLPSPVINMISSNVDTLVCNTAWSCQWYLDGNPIPGANSTSLVPAANGIYTVEVTDGNGCIGSSPELSYTTLTANEINKSDLVSFFPNPAKDKVIIHVSAEMVNQKLQLIDFYGAVVRDITLNNIDNYIDLDGISDGVYFSLVNSLGQKQITRIIITR